MKQRYSLAVDALDTPPGRLQYRSGRNRFFEAQIIDHEAGRTVSKLGTRDIRGRFEPQKALGESPTRQDRERTHHRFDLVPEIVEDRERDGILRMGRVSRRFSGSTLHRPEATPTSTAVGTTCGASN